MSLTIGDFFRLFRLVESEKISRMEIHEQLWSNPKLTLVVPKKSVKFASEFLYHNAPAYVDWQVKPLCSPMKKGVLVHFIDGGDSLRTKVHVK